MQSQSYAFSVAATQERLRLDRFLAQALPSEANLSRTRLAQLIERGAVEVDGNPSHNRAQTLRTGQRVSLSFERPTRTTEQTRAELTRRNTATSPPLEVLFEDAHILCFVKPAGLISHPAPSTNGETLVDRLCRHAAPMLAGYPEDPRCGIVHRLDKNTSGVMLAAKTEEASVRLSEMFASHRLERGYLALVWGIPAPASGSISAALARHPTQRTKRAICRDTKKQGKARRAVTHYRTLQSFGNIASLLSCELETGRTHQIRVHLASIGSYIIGDELYKQTNPDANNKANDKVKDKIGDKVSDRVSDSFASLQSELADSVPSFFASSKDRHATRLATRHATHLATRHALHATHLAFAHPITREPLSFTSPAPPDFQELQDCLQYYLKYYLQ